MARVRLTKNALRKQKDNLQMFNRYLPMLQLRQQQLQREINKNRMVRESLRQDIENYQNQVYQWVDVFAENLDLSQWLNVKEIVTSIGNIAGIDIPVFERVEFQIEDYDFLTTPFWIDYGLEALQKMIELTAEMKVKEEQERILREELRIATQRVNLFEQVKIPEAQENIREITIYLGDQQTASVIRGKIAKAKK